MTSIRTDLDIIVSVGTDFFDKNLYIDVHYEVDKYTKKGKDNVMLPLIELNSNVQNICLITKKYIIDKFEKSFREEKELWEKVFKIKPYKSLRVKFAIYDPEDRSDKDLISILLRMFNEAFKHLYQEAIDRVKENNPKELTNINIK